MQSDVLKYKYILLLQSDKDEANLLCDLLTQAKHDWEAALIITKPKNFHRVLQHNLDNRKCYK